MTDEKLFCECMMNNPFNGNITKMGEITVMGMVNNIPARWPTISCFNNTSPKLETLNDDEKVLICLPLYQFLCLSPWAEFFIVKFLANFFSLQTKDNSLIDSLRGEIEKVRHRLCEIGKRPCGNLHTNPTIQKENSMIAHSPSGDHDYQSQLVKEIRDLQERNDELSKQLENSKDLQEHSMKKAKDTAHLISAYENKVNSLHEQALKSSKIMAHSKEKFCNILRSRNAQIKNLFQINQQLKKTLSINQDQMNQLTNNYRSLKYNYRELEKSEKKFKEENVNFRETLRRLEEELKFVYKECSLLKDENVRFLKVIKYIQNNQTLA